MDPQELPDRFKYASQVQEQNRERLQELLDRFTPSRLPTAVVVSPPRLPTAVVSPVQRIEAKKKNVAEPVASLDIAPRVVCAALKPLLTSALVARLNP